MRSPEGDKHGRKPNPTQPAHRLLRPWSDARSSRPIRARDGTRSLGPTQRRLSSDRRAAAFEASALASARRQPACDERRPQLRTPPLDVRDPRRASPKIRAAVFPRWFVCDAASGDPSDRRRLVRFQQLEAPKRARLSRRRREAAARFTYPVRLRMRGRPSSRRRLAPRRSPKRAGREGCQEPLWLEDGGTDRRSAADTRLLRMRRVAVAQRSVSARSTGPVSRRVALDRQWTRSRRLRPHAPTADAKRHKHLFPTGCPRHFPPDLRRPVGRVGTERVVGAAELLLGGGCKAGASLQPSGRSDVGGLPGRRGLVPYRRDGAARRSGSSRKSASRGIRNAGQRTARHRNPQPGRAPARRDASEDHMGPPSTCRSCAVSHLWLRSTGCERWPACTASRGSNRPRSLPRSSRMSGLAVRGAPLARQPDMATCRRAVWRRAFSHS